MREVIAIPTFLCSVIRFTTDFGNMPELEDYLMKDSLEYHVCQIIYLSKIVTVAFLNFIFSHMRRFFVFCILKLVLIKTICIAVLLTIRSEAKALRLQI